MELSEKTLKFLWTAFIVLIVIVAVQNTLIFFSLHSQQLTGLPTGQGNITLCVTGHPPSWLNPVDCDDAVVGLLFSCDISAQLQGISAFQYNITVLSGNPNGTALFSNVSTAGNLSFTAAINQTGAYELQLRAQAQTACALSNTTTFNVTVLPNLGPPVLLQPIPNSSWTEGTVLVPYNMRSYWFDPAGAVEFLTYNITGNSQISVAVGPTGEVTLTPDPGFCGIEYVRYIAISPWTGLFTESNLVELEVECLPDPAPVSSGGGGGGGGGGGPSVPPRACVEGIFCYEWSTCQYTSAVTETGNPLELNIEGVRGSQVYLVEDIPENVSVFYEGYSYRECFDTNQCSDRTMFYTRVCEYQPSCFDGIQNQNEEGVDCGGVCPACNPITGEDEQEGVITPPVRIEEPLLVQPESRLTLFLMYLVLGLLLLLGFLLSARSLVKSLIAKLVFKHKRKNRVLLLSIDAKQRILDALKDIETRVGKEPTLKLQEELSGVGREYFKEILGLDYEFTYEELVEQLKAQHIMELLQEILQAFFARASELEFSGKPITETMLLALINEVREIVYQTAVLSKQDYKELDRELTFRPVPDSIPIADRFYLTASQGHIALQFGRLGVAQQTYATLQRLYAAASHQQQIFWYQDLKRFYLELSLALKREGSLFTKRGRREKT